MLAHVDLILRSMTDAQRFDSGTAPTHSGGIEERLNPDRPLLQVEGLHAWYGDSHVLHGLRFEAGVGECVALMGRNGAGKTTALKSILGLVPRREGTILFCGSDISQEQTYRIARLGIGYVPEHRGIFPSLSVLEHLRLAARRSRGGTYTIEAVLEMFPSLKRRLELGGSQLSGGEQQMLAIARGLLCNPRLLILDEPSEGLAPIIVEHLGNALEQIKRQGTPLLLVEQNYSLAASLADRAYVLSQGEIKFNGTISELEANEEVRVAYLGVG